MLTANAKADTQGERGRPLTFMIPMVYSFVFAGMYLLYGGIDLVLGFLERDYSGFGETITFIVVGAALLWAAYSLRAARPVGWYAVTGINALVVLLALFNLGNVYSILVLVLSVVSVVLLLLPPTTHHVFPRR